MLRETAELLEASAKNLHDRLLPVMLPMGVEPSEGRDRLPQASNPARCDVVDSLARVENQLTNTGAILAEIIVKLRL